MPAPCRPYEISSCIIPLTGERHKRGWEEFPVRLGGIAFLTGRKLFAKGFLLGVALWCFLSTGNFSPIVSLLDLALWCFLPTGNCLRRVSCSTRLHCVSCRQETIREGFPARRGSTVFLADRKLFAKGFLPGVAPLCFLPAGNFSRIVSYSTWLHCVSCRQETVCEGFPARLGTVVFLTDRQLFAYSFLLDVAPLCFLPAGNYSRRVSYSTWLHCVSCRQETSRQEISRLRFATLEMTEGRGSIVFLADRKLFAYSFLLDLALWCFLPTGNFSRGVSCSTWLHCVSYRQETIREGFPTRRDTVVFLIDRKLFDGRFLDSASLRSK